MAHQIDLSLSGSQRVLAGVPAVWALRVAEDDIAPSITPIRARTRRHGEDAERPARLSRRRTRNGFVGGRAT